MPSVRKSKGWIKLVSIARLHIFARVKHVLLIWLLLETSILSAQPNAFRLPKIDMVALSGDTIYADSLVGKIVYVNFWASWSVNSRKHNKAQLKLFERFRQENLRRQTPIVFISISIDENAEYLKAAIGQDDLHWPYNVCDFKGWQSPLVKAFKVQALPANFIFDTTGTLLYQNKWGAQLDTMLTKTYNDVSN